MQKVLPITSMPPEQVRTFYLHGHALYSSGLYGKAQEIFEILCLKEPLEGRFWFALAACRQEEKNYIGALSAWAVAALLDPEDPSPHFHAMCCAMTLNRVSDAQKALQSCEAKLSPHHPLKNPLEAFKKQHRDSLCA